MASSGASSSGAQGSGAAGSGVARESSGARGAAGLSPTVSTGAAASPAAAPRFPIRYPFLHPATVLVDGLPKGGFRRDLVEPLPFQVYPMERVFDPIEQCGEKKVTAVIHVGGVTHAGIPAYVGLDNVLYVGGYQERYGWIQRYCMDDPDGRQKYSVDELTGQRYHNCHDGFCGFMMYKCLDNLLRWNNTSPDPHNQPGPEFRKLMQDLALILQTATDRMVASVMEGGPPRLDLGILCRQGRHRSNALATMIGALLAEAGYTVVIASWDLNPEPYVDGLGKRSQDTRGPCGCREGNCCMLGSRMTPRQRTVWNRDAARVKEEARRLFVTLAWHHIPSRLLNGACAAWYSRDTAEDQGGASGAAGSCPPASAGASLDPGAVPEPGSSDDGASSECMDVLMRKRGLGFLVEQDLPPFYARLVPPAGPGKAGHYGLIWLGPWPLPGPTAMDSFGKKAAGRFHSELWDKSVDMEGESADYWYYRQCRVAPNEGRCLLVLVGAEASMRCYESEATSPTRSVRKSSTGCFHVLVDGTRRDADRESYRTWKVIGHPLFVNASPLYLYEKDPAEASREVVAPVENTRLIRVDTGSASAAAAAEEPPVCEASKQILKFGGIWTSSISEAPPICLPEAGEGLEPLVPAELPGHLQVIYVRPPPGTPAGVARDDVPLRVYGGVPGSVIRVVIPRQHVWQDIAGFTVAAAQDHWQFLGYCPIKAAGDVRLDYEGRPISAHVGNSCRFAFLPEGIMLDGVWKLPVYRFEPMPEINGLSDSEFDDDGEGCRCIKITFPHPGYPILPIVEIDIVVQKDYSVDEVYRGAFEHMHNVYDEAEQPCPVDRVEDIILITREYTIFDSLSPELELGATLWIYWSGCSYTLDKWAEQTQTPALYKALGGPKVVVVTGSTERCCQGAEDMPGHKDPERRALARRRAAQKFGGGEGRSGASSAAGSCPSVSAGAAASSEDPRASNKLSPEPPVAKDPSSYGFAVKKALFETAQTQSVEVQKRPLLELRDVFRALPAGAVRSKCLVFGADVSPTAVKELNVRLTAAEDLEKELRNGTVRQEVRRSRLCTWRAMRCFGLRLSV